MSAEIKIGSTVRLKSGGPKMTVSSIDKQMGEDRLSAWCDWFIEEKGAYKKESGVFPLTSLEIA
ncbi:DUF2158 domain-containing protein [Brucella sp. 6810]|uniref:DUF2158 domain-containing protein n=1 Tax=Brucella sp. 6810 TaxID=2769351 RepID=UPI00165BEEDC|nr:DUF2158 domain-containing protein [Brucella sp. 6810]QNQ64319.1 DUF2158 domain-containing protein [Brucella sp. 6810]